MTITAIMTNISVDVKHVREHEVKLMDERKPNNDSTTILPPVAKLCTKCKELKRIEEFSRNKGGYQSWCRTCTNAASRARNQARYATDMVYRRKVLDDKAATILEQRRRAAAARVQQKLSDD